MITEDYVSFETAKLLKEKGFDSKCAYTLIPTLQMAMKWLREVHSKSIEVRSQGLKSTGIGWITEIYNLENQDEEYHNPFAKPSYEEACEAAIKYCLENLI